jgi:hypothetical protein
LPAIAQQRQVSLVELVLAKQNNPADLAAYGDEPRERGEKSKARGGRLLTLRRLPILGSVWLVVGHDQFS